MLGSAWRDERCSRRGWRSRRSRPPEADGQTQCRAAERDARFGRPWTANVCRPWSSPAEGRRLLIRAAFFQAEEDGVTILEIGEDVWGLGKFFHGNIEELAAAFETAHREIAPEIELRLQIGLSRHCDIAYLEECLSHFWGCKAFYSLDLYGDELAQPIENFKPIYRRAKALL